MNNYLDLSFNLHLDCFNESLSHYFSESLPGIRTWNASVILYLDSSVNLYLESQPGMLQLISTWSPSVNIYLNPWLIFHLRCFSESLPGLLQWISTWTASVNLYLDCFSESLPGPPHVRGKRGEQPGLPSQSEGGVRQWRLLAPSWSPENSKKGKHVKNYQESERDCCIARVFFFRYQIHSHIHYA